MTQVLRLVGTALAGGVAAFFVATATLTVPGCGGDETDGADAAVEYCEANVAGCCKKPKDCGANQFDWICSSAGSCIPLCKSSADCPGDEICEDAVCRPQGCGSDNDCPNDQQCISGACEAAPQASAVASCQVLPEAALVKTGATKSFSVVAKDADGKTLAYKGAVDWTVDESDRGAVVDGVLTGGATAGAVKVQAKVGSTDCAPASVENFATPATDKVRVIVADIATQQPVSAKIVFNGDAAVEAADGVFEFDKPAGAFDVHAFPADDGDDKFAWVSVYGTTSNDVLLYTKKTLAPARFTGHMTARSFDNLSDIKGNIRLALHGGSIAGNIFDIELSSLVGELVETKIDIAQLKDPVPLPEGTVIGLGEQMFRGAGDNPFAIVSSAGVRTLWGLGGNAELTKILEAVGPAINASGGAIDIGGILTQLLPMLGRLQSGALTGVVAEAGKTTSIDGDDGLSKLKLSTLLRLRVDAELPELPRYKTKNKEGATVDMPFEGAVVLGGALNGTQGLVPMGLTAGIDENEDGKIDADDVAGTPAGKVALRVAPLHSGMETSQYVVLSLAASFGGLIGGGDGDGPGLVLSGLVHYPETLSFNNGKPTELKVGDSFLNVPDLPEINGRVLSAGSKVDGAAFQRLSVGDAEDGEWLVYFKPGTDVSVTLPEPPAGLTDRFVKAGDDQPQTLLHSVRLNDSSLDYDKVIEFGSDNLDDLSAKIEAFSLIEIER